VLIELAERLRDVGFDGGGADLTAVTDMVWSALHGIVSIKVWCDGFPATPAEELVRLTAQTLLQGLRSHPTVSERVSSRTLRPVARGFGKKENLR
jgi:hypothetical protein